MKRVRKIFLGTLIPLSLIYIILIVVTYLPYVTTPIEDLAAENARFIALLVHMGKREKEVLPELANRINSEIKGSVLASVRESGHYLQEEQPEALALIIRDFLG